MIISSYQQNSQPTFNTFTYISKLTVEQEAKYVQKTPEQSDIN